MNHVSMPYEQVKKEFKKVEDILLTLGEEVEDEDTQKKKKGKKDFTQSLSFFHKDDFLYEQVKYPLL